MQHCPKYGLCNPDWVNRPGFSCNFWSAFSLANFLLRGLNCLVVASKRRLQLSTDELLINGNEQTFKNDRVMPNLRGIKKHLRTFRPHKIGLIQANIHFNRILPELFPRWEGFFWIIDLLKINFTNKSFTFKKTAFYKNMKRMENYLFAEFL